MKIMSVIANKRLTSHLSNKNLFVQHAMTLILVISLLFSAGLNIMSATFFFLISYACLVTINSKVSFIVPMSLLLSLTPFIIGSLFPQSAWYSVWISAFVMCMTFFCFKRGVAFRELIEHSQYRINVILIVVNTLVLLGSGRDRLDLWAWQFRGDGINFIVGMRNLSSYKTLAEGVFLNAEESGISLGQTFLFQWLAQSVLNGNNSTNFSLNSIGEAFIGVQFLFLSTVLMTYLHAKKSNRFLRDLPPILAILTIFLGPLVLGLSMSNGFLTIPMTIVFLLLILLNIQEVNLRSEVRVYLVLQCLLLILLFAVWSLLAILAFFMVLHQLNRKLNIDRDSVRGLRSLNTRFELTVNALALLFTSIFFTMLFSLDYIKQNIFVSGGFPKIYFGQFFGTLLLILLGLQLTKKITQINYFSYLLIPLSFFSSMLIAYISILGWEVILELQSNSWDSRLYYLQKSYWILFGTFTLLLALTLLPRKLGNTLCIFFVSMNFIIGQPSAIWNSDNRKLVSYDGIEEISARNGERVMFINYDSWLGDSYLNQLSGLQFESYTGHDLGGKKFATTFYMPAESFASGKFYTTEQNALCRGQELVGTTGLIITSDRGIPDKLVTLCGPQTFPRVEYREP